MTPEKDKSQNIKSELARARPFKKKAMKSPRDRTSLWTRRCCMRIPISTRLSEVLKCSREMTEPMMLKKKIAMRFWGTRSTVKEPKESKARNFMDKEWNLTRLLTQNGRTPTLKTVLYHQHQKIRIVRHYKCRALTSNNDVKTWCNSSQIQSSTCPATPTLRISSCHLTALWIKTLQGQVQGIQTKGRKWEQVNISRCLIISTMPRMVPNKIYPKLRSRGRRPWITPIITNHSLTRMSTRMSNTWRGKPSMPTRGRSSLSRHSLRMDSKTASTSLIIPMGMTPRRWKWRSATASRTFRIAFQENLPSGENQIKRSNRIHRPPNRTSWMSTTSGRSDLACWARNLKTRIKANYRS